MSDPDERPEDAAVEAEPRIRREEDREEVLAVARLADRARVPLVDDVVEPTAEKGESTDQQQGVPDVVAGDAAALSLRLGDEEHDGKGNDVADAVPTDVERPELNGNRVRRDGDQREHGGSIPILGPMSA